MEGIWTLNILIFNFHWDFHRRYIFFKDDVTVSGRWVCLSAPPKLKRIRMIRTMPYPGFPTDVQAQMMALTTICGCSCYEQWCEGFFGQKVLLLWDKCTEIHLLNYIILSLFITLKYFHKNRLFVNSDFAKKLHQNVAYCDYWVFSYCCCYVTLVMSDSVTHMLF